MNEQMQAVREKVLQVLQKNDVKRAAFFGSIVRGEMTEESDIDILIEFEGRKSLLDLAHLKNELEDAINRRVDLLTYRSLHPRLKERILAEQVPITMKKDPSVFLGHILESIDLIESYSEGVDEIEFMRSPPLQDKLVRRIEIIGEAVKNLPEDLKREHPEVPWRDIAGLRDIIVHQYFGLDPELIWDVVKRDIPELKPKLKRIQEELE